MLTSSHDNLKFSRSEDLTLIVEYGDESFSANFRIALQTIRKSCCLGLQNQAVEVPCPRGLMYSTCIPRGKFAYWKDTFKVGNKRKNLYIYILLISKHSKIEKFY